MSAIIARCPAQTHANVNEDNPADDAVDQAEGGHQQSQVFPDRKIDDAVVEHFAHRTGGGMSTGKARFNQHSK